MSPYLFLYFLLLSDIEACHVTHVEGTDSSKIRVDQE